MQIVVNISKEAFDHMVNLYFEACYIADVPIDPNDDLSNRCAVVRIIEGVIEGACKEVASVIPVSIKDVANDE